MSDRIVLREFSSRAEAEIVRELLESASVEAYVTSDDCGQVDPALQFARGAKLWVAEEDEARAEEAITQGMAAWGEPPFNGATDDGPDQEL